MLKMLFAFKNSMILSGGGFFQWFHFSSMERVDMTRDLEVICGAFSMQRRIMTFYWKCLHCPGNGVITCAHFDVN